MGIIGWISRHLVLTLLIVAVVAGYIYRDELNEELKLQEFAEKHDLARYWPAWTPQTMTVEADEATAEEVETEAPKAEEPLAEEAKTEEAKAGEAKAEEPEAEKPQTEEAKAEEPKTETAAAPAAEPAAEKAPETAAAAKPEAPAEQSSEAAKSTETAAAAPAPAPEPKAEAAPAPTPVAKAEAPAQPVAAPAAAPAPAPAAAPAPVSDDLRADWMAARKAFWDGDLQAAEAKYIKLMAAHADEPDLAGELGNMYLRQGKREEAAAMFLEAGRRMLRGPYPVRANSVIAILNGLAPERADELRRDLFDHINQQQAPATSAGQSQ